jgi:hypothetical protein
MIGARGKAYAVKGTITIILILQDISKVNAEVQ